MNKIEYIVLTSSGDAKLDFGLFLPLYDFHLSTKVIWKPLRIMSNGYTIYE